MAQVSRQIAQTVETSGAITESEDLSVSVAKLRKSLKRTRMIAVAVWVLCIITFIGRFCM